jgi:hypothetical protein
MFPKPVVAAMAALALLLCVNLGLPAASDERLPPGTEIEFIIRSGWFVGESPQYFNILQEGTVVVTAGPATAIVPFLGDCSASPAPILPALFLHPGEGQPPVSDMIIPTTPDLAIPSGTRLGQFVLLGRCGGTQFDRLRGTVE